MWVKNTNRNTRLYCEQASARTHAHKEAYHEFRSFSKWVLGAAIFFNWRMRGGMFQSGTVSWIQIQDGGYNKKRLPREWSEERCELPAVVTGDRQSACQLHLSAARHSLAM
jgi:hypothetical protein